MWAADGRLLEGFFSSSYSSGDSAGSTPPPSSDDQSVKLHFGSGASCSDDDVVTLYRRATGSKGFTHQELTDAIQRRFGSRYTLNNLCKITVGDGLDHVRVRFLCGSEHQNRVVLRRGSHVVDDASALRFLRQMRRLALFTRCNPVVRGGCDLIIGGESTVPAACSCSNLTSLAAVGCHRPDDMGAEADADAEPPPYFAPAPRPAVPTTTAATSVPAAFCRRPEFASNPPYDDVEGSTEWWYQRAMMACSADDGHYINRYRAFDDKCPDAPDVDKLAVSDRMADCDARANYDVWLVIASDDDFSIARDGNSGGPVALAPGAVLHYPSKYQVYTQGSATTAIATQKVPYRGPWLNLATGTNVAMLSQGFTLRDDCTRRCQGFEPTFANAMLDSHRDGVGLVYLAVPPTASSSSGPDAAAALATVASALKPANWPLISSAGGARSKMHLRGAILLRPLDRAVADFRAGLAKLDASYARLPVFVVSKEASLASTVIDASSGGGNNTYHVENAQGKRLYVEDYAKEAGGGLAALGADLAAYFRSNRAKLLARAS